MPPVHLTSWRDTLTPDKDVSTHVTQTAVFPFVTVSRSHSPASAPAFVSTTKHSAAFVLLLFHRSRAAGMARVTTRTTRMHNNNAAVGHRRDLAKRKVLHLLSYAFVLSRAVWWLIRCSTTVGLNDCFCGDDAAGSTNPL